MVKCEFDEKIADKLLDDVEKYVPDRLVECTGIEDVLKRLLKHYFYQMRFTHGKMDNEQFTMFMENRINALRNLAHSDIDAIIIDSINSDTDAGKYEKTDSEIKLDKYESVDKEKK